MTKALSNFCLVWLCWLGASAPAQNLEHPLPALGAQHSLTGVWRQPDGKWLLSYFGYNINGNNVSYDNHVLRVNADFSTDATFHPLDYTSSHQVLIFPVQLQMKAGGFLMISLVYRLSSENTYTLLQSFHEDGTLDESFGDGGNLELNIGLTGRENPSDAVLQTDGKILIAMFELPTTNSAQPWLVRLNSDGTLDTDYGTDGKLAISPEQPLARLPSYQLRPDGSATVLINDAPTNTLSILALDPNGQPRAHFGKDGKIPTGIRSRDYTNSILAGADGSIAVIASDSTGAEVALFDRAGHRSPWTPADPPTILQATFPIGESAPGPELVFAGSAISDMYPPDLTKFEYWVLNEKGLQHQTVSRSEKISGRPVAIFTVGKTRYVFLSSDTAPGVLEMPL